MKRDNSPAVTEGRTIQIDFNELPKVSIETKVRAEKDLTFSSSEDQIDTKIFSNQTMQSAIKLESATENEGCLELEVIYSVNEKLGEGGQGIIRLADDKFLNREVVVKTLKEEFHQTSVRKTFINEAKVTAQLDHPSTVPVYSIHTEGEKGISFSMKRIKGLTFEDYIEKVIEIYKNEGISVRKEKKSLFTRLEHFLKVCDALHYAHQKKVIHRDLKPENIMICEFGEVYVMDWGIAYFEDENTTENEVPLCGTRGYIDPQLLNKTKPNAQSDIFSLGMILHQICTLRQGFSDLTLNKTFIEAAKGEFGPVEHFFPEINIHEDLVAIINKARDPDIKVRYKTVLELSDDIRRFMQNEEVSCRPDNVLRKSMRWGQNNPFKVFSLVLASILIFSSVIIYSLYLQNKTITEARQRESKLANLLGKVANRAHSIDNQFLKIEMLMAQLAEKFSAGSGSGHQGKIFSSAEFSVPESSPAGTRFSEVFGKKVNVDTPVYKLAPGIKLENVEPHIRKLYKFKPDFLKLVLKSEIKSPTYLGSINDIKSRIYTTAFPVKWVYCGFENGVFVSYPGKGGYPESYDHRKRPWYLEAKMKHGLNWSKPYYDINGLGLVLPCTFTLKENSQFSGVLALDMTLDFIADELIAKNSKQRQGFIESVIVDHNGEIVAGSSLLKKNMKTTELNNTSISRTVYPDKDVIKLIKGDTKDMMIKETNSRKEIFCISKIETLNWFYIERLNLDQFLNN